jgi:excisionase family DNA binding protein
MFYSLKEAAERLGKSEQEVSQLTKDGKLREFRDGANVLFKIDEVNALLDEGVGVEGADLGTGELELEEVPEQAEGGEVDLEATDLELEEAPEQAEAAEMDLEATDLGLEEVPEQAEAVETGPEAADLGLEEVPEQAEAAEMGLEATDLGLEEVVDQEQPAEVPAEESAPMPEEPAAVADESFDDDMFKLDEEETPAVETTDETDATSELGLAPVAEEQEAPAEEDLFLLDEDQQPAAPTPEGSEEEISLAPESGILASESDITDMDTALTGEGVSVLGESDVDYDVTDDSMAETASPAGTGTEASLEEIEEDVNLDSFGSGSGLLDLSLQADDTSLGGILDEIYTAEGGEEEAVPADEASFEELTAEVERPPAEEELAVPEPAPMMPTAAPVAYAEALPDTQSNVLGTLLFLPLLALLYTAIVTVAAMRNVMPSILGSIQGMVWYITGGAIVVALIVVGASFALGGERAPKAAKPKKAKAEKPKKEKKAKAEKPAKEKKGLFGKKK